MAATEAPHCWTTSGQRDKELLVEADGAPVIAVRTVTTVRTTVRPECCFAPEWRLSA